MSYKAKKSIALTVVLLFVLFAVFYYSTHVVKKPDGSSLYKIAVLLPLTGPGAAYANQVLDGINLAYQDLKESKKITENEFVLLVEDTETDTKKAVNALNKFISIDKVQIVIGELASSITLACAPIAERNKVLLFSPGSSADAITTAGDYIFRIAPTDSYDGEFLANEMVQRYGVNTASILYLNNDFGIGLKDVFTKKFEALGGKVVLTEGVNMGSNNYKTPVSNLREAYVDAILLIAASDENITAIKEIRQLGIKSKIFAPSSFNNPEIPALAGGAAEGIIFSAASFDGIKDQENVARFLRLFEKKYPQKTPTTFTAYGYDAMMILVQEIKKNGYDAEVVKNSLYKMPPFYGASGVTTFDENGDAKKELTLFVVKDGNFMAIGGK